MKPFIEVTITIESETELLELCYIFDEFEKIHGKLPESIQIISDNLKKVIQEQDV